jgi:hypothetical protein
MPQIYQHQESSKLRSFDSLYQILEEDKILKSTGQLFTEYKSSYPFNSEVSLNALKSIAAENGRLQLYEGFYLWFSDYYSYYSSTINALMCDNDCIPVTWKYYLAIMAVSSIKCEFMFKYLEIEFLLKGGDKNWLIQGLEAVPPKIKKLEKLNNIFANQPWKIKIQDLNEVYSKCDKSGWSQNELVIAMTILFNFHRIATIVESIKIGVKEKGYEPPPQRKDEDAKIDDSKVLIFKNEEVAKKKIISELELINQNEKEQKEPVTRKMSGESNKALNNSFEMFPQTMDFSKHVSSFCTVYLDFDSHSEEYSSYFVKIFF